MLRHIVMWNYKSNFSEAENRINAQQVKKELEALKDSIKEIIEISVHINNISTSNMDIMLDSLFESEEDLTAYKVHPEHVRVADFIGKVTQNRVCFDYYN